MGNLTNLNINAERVVGDIPDGEYVAKITADTIKDDAVTLTFTICEGEFYGRTVPSTYKLWSDSEKTRGGAMYAFALLCKACGVNNPQDTTDLRGIPILLNVGHREYNGKTYTNVQSVKPYTQPQASNEAPF